MAHKNIIIKDLKTEDSYVKLHKTKINDIILISTFAYGGTFPTIFLMSYLHIGTNYQIPYAR